ncbi:MerR family transcriptional regulator [Alicyclobacillus acidocaldarius]|uniref:Transcriptional regulator, MerR family n=1 Tax=Alicyclobacillus acidocaldarius (strain Tc-4-1) TaxID=1048834 RepID=F8IHT0_ALIAT|nr:MerR family transcriptional regulator [Alicyclobacillus acidocaldarius]AEJ42047.1 transcriptional regulator, MerR family [Alicyclobacillus acidocaldarius subsp. acidocaldarius Tc-4-1]
MDRDKLWTVEAAAERLGVTPRTLHYYEEMGLIPEVRRTPGGHRLYDEETIERMEHILRLKDALGYSLQEIRSILATEDQLKAYRERIASGHEPECNLHMLTESVRLLEDVVRHIDEKMARLAAMRERYVDRLTRIRDRLQREQSALQAAQEDEERR